MLRGNPVALKFSLTLGSTAVFFFLFILVFKVGFGDQIQVLRLALC